MEDPPNAIGTLCFTLGASTYFGVGILGSLADFTPHLVPALSVVSSLLVGAGAPLCLKGIGRLRALRDESRAREAAPAHAQPAH